MSGATTGKFGIYYSKEKAYQNQRVGNFKLFSKKYIVKLFLYYLLFSLKSRIEKDAYGGAQPNISSTKIEAISFQLPPLLVQKAIVAKLESLLTNLDQGIVSLEKAAAQLKIYRQAVLKKAFEGELTKAWRAQQTDLPSAEELLAQIKEERQKHYEQQVKDWEQAVVDWEAEGKVGRKPSKPKKLKELLPISKEEIKELGDLPVIWTVCFSEAISEFITKGTTPNKKDLSEKVGDVPFIKVYNLTFNGTLDFSINPTFVSKEVHNKFLKRSIIYPNDILMNIVGPPMGKVSIVPASHKEWNINQAIVRFRPFNLITTKYLSYFLMNSYTIHRLTKKSKATAGQFNLTLEICRSVVLPICSKREQIQIVQEIESRLSVCDNLAETIKTNLQKAKALRQSILKKAFEGRLLTDVELAACRAAPDYEPAAVLLERIKKEKAERAALAKAAKEKAKKTKKKKQIKK